MASRRTPQQVLALVSRKFSSTVSSSTKFALGSHTNRPRNDDSVRNYVEREALLALAEYHLSHHKMLDHMGGRHSQARNFSSSLSHSHTEIGLGGILQDTVKNLSNSHESEELEAAQLKTEEVLDFIELEKPLVNSSASILLQKEDIEEALTKMRAKDIQMLHVSDRCDWADTLVVATGISDRHLRGMADALIYALRKQDHKLTPKQFPTVEGGESGDWLVVDFGSIVVHLLSEEARKLYDLETLWTKELKMEVIPQA